MSSQTITLSLPASVFQRAQVTAHAAKRTVEEVLTATLAAALPDLIDAPPEIREDLARMTLLDEKALWEIARRDMPTDQQTRLAKLAAIQSQRQLNDAEVAELDDLRQEYGLTTLRKARAFALLSMRSGQLLLAEN